MIEEQSVVVFDGFDHQNLDVLFQEEVQLDINVPLFYIKSGEEEIQYYVNTVSKPELDAYSDVKKEEMAAAAEEYVEETILPEIKNHVDENVIPELDAYKTAAENAKTGAVSAAASAAASATEAETAAALAAQSAVQAETAAASAGVPAGGLTGQFLRKSSNADNATEWADVDALPAQAGQNGKYLTTDGSTASWASIVMPTIEYLG